jgi:hypothetical protein
MRPPYDDHDPFDFEDSTSVKKILREQQREELRHKRRRGRGRAAALSFDDESELEFSGDFDDLDDFDDYDEDEFDEYSDLTLDH